jgi:hypothetical protein
MTQQFKLRLPATMRAALDEAAREAGISVNNEIVQRLDRSLHVERVLGGRETARLGFAMAAAFVAATEGKENWSSDPVAYTAGVTAVIGMLIRSVPQGPDRPLAIDGVVGGLLTTLANDPDARPQEQSSKERAA